MTLTLRRCGWLLASAGLLALLADVLLSARAPASAQAQGSGSSPVITVLEVEGLIDRTLVRYVTAALADANATNAELLVLQLDTAGGLAADINGLVDTILASDVPVVSWVGAQGARATGAGMLIASASHVLVMAPPSTLGDAVPIDLADGRDDEATRRAVAQRLVELARLRGRDADFAAATALNRTVAVAGTGVPLPPDAVLPDGLNRDQLVVFGPDELVEAGIADFVAASLPEVLANLNGRSVEIGGASRAFGDYADTSAISFDNLGLGGRALHTVVDPSLAYLLLIGGALTLVFEIFQPGFGVAGVAGLGLGALGLYGFTVLPTNPWAMLALFVGLVLMSLDLALARLGALTAAGIVAFAAGSYWLVDGPALLSPPLWLIVLIVLFALSFFVVIMTMVLRAQGSQALAVAEDVVGKVGVVRSMLNPEGHVFIGGALWRARAPEELGKVKTGTEVRVLGMNDRLTLDVELVDSSSKSATT